MTKNSPLCGSRPGVDALRSASVTHNYASALQKAASGGSLSLAGASIWRIPDKWGSNVEDTTSESPCISIGSGAAFGIVSFRMLFYIHSSVCDWIC